MYGGNHRRFYQPGIRKRQKIEVIVDDIKLIRLFHQVADVQTLQNLGIPGAVFLVTLFANTIPASRR
jgi:hypothetical protein